MKSLKETVKIKNVKFAHMNKAATLADYIKECADGDYSERDITSSLALHFTSRSEYEEFANNLLEDRDCLDGLGGADNAAIVYFKGKRKFVIVTEGYSYARYVGLID